MLRRIYRAAIFETKTERRLGYFIAYIRASGDC